MNANQVMKDLGIGNPQGPGGMVNVDDLQAIIQPNPEMNAGVKDQPFNLNGPGNK